GLPSSVSRMPAEPPVAPPPPSERRLPIPVAAPARPPAPSVPDLEGGPRSRRPPPPLPSQVKKG
ncbi:MAG: hypothetical protein KF837_36220, partial [Labilithrix sp.]|nr:hypothetical protein [Labilithrix sp.]